MSKSIILTEKQIKTIIENTIDDQSELDEYGVKGMTKDDTYLWDEGDQTLAMYNAEYGIEDLHITKEDVVNEIIGSTVGSLGKQTSNFNFLAGRGGLDRPNKMQSLVYEKFKGIDKNDFRRICLKLIEDRYQNPTERVKKRKLGKLIGGKRENIVKTREDLLRDKGVNPNHTTMIGQRPKYDPVVDDEPEEPMDSKKLTPKDEVRSYLKQVYDKIINNNPELADDIQFISDYIDSELVDKQMVAEIRKLFKITIMENKTNKMKKTIRINESDIKNIVKRILKEQTFNEDGDFEDNLNENKMKKRNIIVTESQMKMVIEQQVNASTPRDANGEPTKQPQKSLGEVGLVRLPKKDVDPKWSEYPYSELEKNNNSVDDQHIKRSIEKIINKHSHLATVFGINKHIIEDRKFDNLATDLLIFFKKILKKND